jgi:hypothetical protein
VPADEFRQHYASLSEEGLREINRADLTDAARASYDQELASRGLTIESAPPKAPPDDIAWVPLDTFPPEEIKLVRALLHAEEIPTHLDSDVLFVPKPLLEQACEILAFHVSDEDLIAEAEADPPPHDA